VAKKVQYVAEIARLRTAAAESRLRAVESQLSLALTLCAIAETEIRYSRLDEAIKVVNKVRHHAETIRLHLDEPNHVPRAAISELRKQLKQVNERIEKIEACLRQV
jgi:TolA-binding protein